ncbi:unnamed protein product, partial [Staurois parvus]
AALVGGHRWVALVGTGGWHWWAQVGGHRWVALLGTCRWHFWAQVGGTAEWHRWGHCCWARVGGASGGALLGGTCGCHCWHCTDHQGTDGNVSLDTADHVVKGRCDW